METAVPTTITHIDNADDASVWRIAADYVSQASLAKRCALGVCTVLSGFGWTVMIGALLILQDAILV